MRLNYNIDENDYLTNLLFNASKSALIKKKRRRNKMIIPIVYTVLGLFLLLITYFWLAILFFAIGFLWFLIYPLREKKLYFKHFRAVVKENYKDRLGRIITLELDNDFILAKDSGSESKILTSELGEISEIPPAIYMILKGGQSFILPKDKIPNIDDVRTRLKEIATYLKIKYNTDEKWKWK